MMMTLLAVMVTTVLVAVGGLHNSHPANFFAFEHVISEPRPCVWAAENEKPLTSLPAMHRPHIPIPPRQHLSNYHPHTLTQRLLRILYANNAE